MEAIRTARETNPECEAPEVLASYSKEKLEAGTRPEAQSGGGCMCGCMDCCMD